jgi:hypothetical protein
MTRIKQLEKEISALVQMPQTRRIKALINVKTKELTSIR